MLSRATARLIAVCLAAAGIQARIAVGADDESGIQRLYAQGQKALAEGEREAALARFQTLVKRHPRTEWSAAAWWEIFRLHEYLGEPEAAFNALDTLITQQPGEFAKAHEEQLRMVRRLLESGRDARRTLERERPSQRIDPEIVVAMLRKIVRNGPHSEVGVQAHYFVALATEKAGKKEDAAAVYEDFLETHPKHELADDAGFQIAHIRYKDWQSAEVKSTGHREKAALAMTYFLARFPQSDKGAQARSCLAEIRSAELRELRSLARYYAASGNPKAAAVYYEQLAVKFPAVVLRDESLRKEILNAGADR